MMPAEQWYVHQSQYQQYGLAMRPSTTKEEKTKSVNPNLGLTGKDRARLLGLIVFAGILCVVLIITTAYAAGVKFEINNALRENQVIQGEIEHLNVKIKTEANLQSVEEKAVSQLGMIYPDSSQFIYVGGESEPSGNFAMLLKEQAYN